MKYRPYEAKESSAIEALFLKTFTDAEGKAEGQLIANLVRDLMLDTSSSDLYGFVSFDESNLSGAIFFSRLTFESDVSAFMLSPVAVHSAHQGKGLGQALINHGLQSLKNEGVDFVITYGDPAFYSKVGFSSLSQEVIKPPFELSQPEGWLGQSLVSEVIEPIVGPCKCVKAFDNPAYW